MLLLNIEILLGMGIMLKYLSKYVRQCSKKVTRFTYFPKTGLSSFKSSNDGVWSKSFLNRASGKGMLATLQLNRENPHRTPKKYLFSNFGLLGHHMQEASLGSIHIPCSGLVIFLNRQWKNSALTPPKSCLISPLNERAPSLDLHSQIDLPNSKHSQSSDSF